MQNLLTFEFEKLTKDVQIKILKMIPISNLVRGVGLVNRRLAGIVKSNELWAEHYINSLENDEFFRRVEQHIRTSLIGEEQYDSMCGPEATSLKYMDVEYPGALLSKTLVNNVLKRRFFLNHEIDGVYYAEYYYDRFMAIWSCFVHAWTNGISWSGVYIWRNTMIPIVWIQYNSMSLQFRQTSVDDKDLQFKFKGMPWVYTTDGKRFISTAAINGTEFELPAAPNEAIPGLQIAAAFAMNNLMYFVHSMVDMNMGDTATIISQLLTNIGAIAIVSPAIRRDIMERIQRYGKLPADVERPDDDLIIAMTASDGNVVYRGAERLLVWEHDETSASLLRSCLTCNQITSRVEQGRPERAFCDAECQKQFYYPVKF